ncbi:MAG: hypothetical protein AB1489_34355 [Acidobacteriota bacterium]
MSKDPSSPVRKVVPYKPGKRLTTFRKLDIDFAGTALEHALALQALNEGPKPDESKLEASPDLTRSADTSSNVIPSEDQDRSDQIQEEFTATRPLDSLANSELSQPSLANEQLSQQQAKLMDSSANTKLSSQPTEPMVSSANEKLSSKQAKLSISSANWYRTYNDLDDLIMPTLQPSEQIVLRRLFRLSYGFNRDTTDQVSLTKLAEKCNLGLATVKIAIKSLEAKGYVEVFSDQSRDPKGGNRYRILTRLIDSSAKDRLGQIPAELNTSSIKHDHDDLKKTDHHQKRSTELAPHLRETMTLYTTLTGNSWSKSDQRTYTQISTIPLPIIESAIRAAINRAASHPGSLSYFVAEIKRSAERAANPNAYPPTLNRNQLKKEMARIIKDMKDNDSRVKGYTTWAEFGEMVKERCGNEGLPYDNGLFEEIMKETGRS